MGFDIRWSFLQWNGRFLKRVPFRIDNNNNIVAYGRYGGKVDFAPGSLVKNLPETDNNYVAKFNSNGQLTWAISIPLPSSDVDLTAYAVKTGVMAVFTWGVLRCIQSTQLYSHLGRPQSWRRRNLHLASAFNGFCLEAIADG